MRNQSRNYLEYVFLLDIAKVLPCFGMTGYYFRIRNNPKNVLVL